MQSIEKRALYNLLRMNWQNDASMPVEAWQVEDYRDLETTAIFERLKKLGVKLDKETLASYSNEYETPEDLTDFLVKNRKLKADEEDRIYLLVFELWRRLLLEQPSVSIICNELDHQIDLFDNGQVDNITPLQDAITNFFVVLEENTDQGVEPKEAFSLLSQYCANDMEAFLYDFVYEQIDQENQLYARELLDDFFPFVADPKWFSLLLARLLNQSNPKMAHKQLLHTMEEHLEENDVEFNLELLSILIHTGFFIHFRSIIQKTWSLLQYEEDFQDLLTICIDYTQHLDQDEQEKSIDEMLKKRSQNPLTKPFSQKDPDLSALKKILDLNPLSE